MLFWRITKYDPRNRETTGFYCKDEWTSYCDIGKEIDDNELTYDQYIKAEDAYIASIVLFMRCNNIKRLRVVNLEKYDDVDNSDQHISELMRRTFDNIKEGIEIEVYEIQLLARLVLREKLWCKLESKSMFVHFGYDYYMYIGSVGVCEAYVKEIKALGLFVEQHISPYKNI